MTEQEKDVPGDAGFALTQPMQINVRLQPVERSDQPIFANITAVQGVSETVFLDFGFLEPQAFGALARMGQHGRKPPEQVDGRLVCRVALGVEAAAILGRQLNQVLQNRPGKPRER